MRAQIPLRQSLQPIEIRLSDTILLVEWRKSEIGSRFLSLDRNPFEGLLREFAVALAAPVCGSLGCRGALGVLGRDAADVHFG